MLFVSVLNRHNIKLFVTECFKFAHHYVVFVWGFLNRHIVIWFVSECLQ